MAHYYNKIAIYVRASFPFPSNHSLWGLVHFCYYYRLDCCTFIQDVFLLMKIFRTLEI